MKASCAVGGCDWTAMSGDPVELAAKAEMHRRERHDWVKVGRCHRADLDPWELDRVERLVEEWTPNPGRVAVNPSDFNRR